MRHLPHLFALQVEQLAHDEKVHRDILNLRTSEKITHMTLHFAKYVGRFFADAAADKEKLKALVTDSVIIALASANVLNVRLDERVSVASVRLLGAEMGGGIRGRNGSGALAACLGKVLALSTADMAKACESYDHLERHPFRETLEAAVVRITELLLSAADLLELDLEARVRARWSAIEQKSIFHRTADSNALVKVG